MAADNIAVMAKGKVVEQGTHHELLERDGLYAAMVRVQELGTQTGPGALGENDNANGDDVLPSYQLSTPSLTRKQSDHKAAGPESEVEPHTAGTLHQSLVRCTLVMLKESTSLYPWYVLIGLAYVFVGGTYAVQAVLFSRLIRVFTLQGEEAVSYTHLTLPTKRIV